MFSSNPKRLVTMVTMLKAYDKGNKQEVDKPIIDGGLKLQIHISQ